MRGRTGGRALSVQDEGAQRAALGWDGPIKERYGASKEKSAMEGL